MGNFLLCRNQIMDALEGPIRRRIQDELDKVDIEKLIHEKIPDIEKRANLLQKKASNATGEDGDEEGSDDDDDRIDLEISNPLPPPDPNEDPPLPEDIINYGED